MRLCEATPDWVVRNSRNKAFYRFDRVEDRGRARIRPLELFPSGLLIPKPTPTTVSGDLDVALVGEWVENMVVQGTPSRSTEQYEQELATEVVRLAELQLSYDALPPGGIGKDSRGSWANKIKNCEARITVLQRGLSFTSEQPLLGLEAETVVGARFAPHQVVQLPSGQPARVLSLTPRRMVRVFTVYRGDRVEAVLPPAMLRPWEQARLCSV